MTTRTALEIAIDLDAASCSSFAKLEAAEALRKQHDEIDRLKRERHHIYDLLARIHRDGGQYTAENGVEKSCDDAEAQVVMLIDPFSNIDALIEKARIAEREVGDMNKHTPGSWRRMGDIVAQDGTTIAIVSPRYDGDEWAANARLVAAAPDLLEVCRRLSHVSLFAVDEDVASIIMLALDAVQKATGKKP